MTTRRIVPATTIMPVPPEKYDRSYMSNLVGMMQRIVLNLDNPATLRGGWLNLSAVKSDAYDLTVGDIYTDGAFLKIVKPGDAGSFGGSASVGVGAVTVTT